MAADLMLPRALLAAKLTILAGILPGTAWGQAYRLTPAGSLSFGSAVSASGDRVAVGAPDEGAGAGAVYVYAYDMATGWSEEVRFGGSQHEAFGRSVALHDRYLLVGAPGGGNVAGGTAYIFRRDSVAWQQVAQLEAPNSAQGDAFGAAVALLNIYVFVGAPRRTVGAPEAGMVYVFEQAGQDQWGFTQALTSSDGGSLFGSAVALESELALIGSPRADEPRGQAAGKAYIYARTGGSAWAERATLVAGDARTESGFGAAVSIDSHDLTGAHTAFVGAPSAGPLKAGAAYLFMEIGGMWTQRARYEPAMRTADDRVGHAVVLDEDNFLVGMPGRDAGAGVGVALAVDTTVYAWQERAWHEAPQRQVAAGFAYAMAMSRRFVVVGAPGEAKTDSTSGAAYVYARPVALTREGAPAETRERLVSYPNPFRDVVTITIGGRYDVQPTLEVYDTLGRRVAVLRASEQLGGKHEVVWRPQGGLPGGVYAAVVRGGTSHALHLMTRVR